jgi:pimeloyl-ACP methyl ester carboxylesterase
MSILERNNVKVVGSGSRPMIFVHGYGCDQAMWRLVTPAFADRYKIVLYDLTGSGQSDLSAYDRASTVRCKDTRAICWKFATRSICEMPLSSATRSAR